MMKRCFVGSVIIALFFLQLTPHYTYADITISQDTTFSGTITLVQDLVLTDSSTLTIGAGTTLLMGEGVSIIGGRKCHVLIQGTAANKVIIKNAIPNTYWGRIIVNGDSASIDIHFADVQAGQTYAMDSTFLNIEDSYLHDYLRMPTKNMVYTENAYYFHMNRCHVSSYFQLNPVNTPVLIENSLFDYIAEDGIDCDNSPSAIIRNCTFRNGLCEKGKVHSVDGVDFGKYNLEGLGSIGEVQNCFFSNITDKGVSAGEGCREVNVSGCLFYRCGSGATIKDSSLAELVNNTIVNCDNGVECVEKNEGLGGGHVTGYNNILWNNATTVYLGSDGTLSMHHSDISFNGIFPGVGNINSYPLFTDTLSQNFQLLPGSPCIGSGVSGVDMGAIFPVGGISAAVKYIKMGIPQSGEIIAGDSTYAISWLVGDSIRFVNLDFSSDGGLSWSSIAQGVSSVPGFYTWTIPNIYSTRCFIRVTDVTDTTVSDTQFIPFTIIPLGEKSPLPVFSKAAGYYNNSIEVEITTDSPTAIFYTLDGSEPTDHSLQYTSPLQLSQEFILPNNPVQNITGTNPPHQPLSFIRTAPQSQIGPTYYAWYQPTGITDKVAVVKARSWSPGYGLGEVVTNTYIIDSTGTLNPGNLPLISITTDKENLFDYYKGIYIPGNYFTGYSWTGNYELTGSESERPVHFEFFDTAGQRKVSLPTGIRIRGEWIRGYGQKALSLFARSEYDSVNYFHYNFFPGYTRNEIGTEMTTYKRLILRNSGNEWITPINTMFKDGCIQSLFDNLKLKIQAQRQTILFLDGEYWGIHNVRELPDKYSLGLTYSIEPDDIAILEHNGEGHNNLQTGTQNDLNDYLGLRDYLMTHDLNSPPVWAYVNTKMDVENFADYWIACLYSQRLTTDHNTGCWKLSEHGYNPNASYGKDGKWRWFIYDFDDTFGNVNFPVLDYFAWDWFKDFLIYPLVTSDYFKNYFITRFADVMNSSFKPARVVERILEKKSEIEPEILRHRNRWGTPYNLTDWQTGIDSLLIFGNSRPFYVFQELQNFFYLGDTTLITLDVNDIEKGKIKINTIQVDSHLPGVNEIVYPWQGAYFRNYPVKLIAIPEPGFRFVQWLETASTQDTLVVILGGDSTFTALFDIDPDYEPTIYPQLFINELAASNNTVFDNYGENADWIELYNPTDSLVDMAGWFITDEPNYPTKHRFISSDSTKIGSHGYLLLFADDETAQGSAHVSFKLSAGGEQIWLIAPDGTTLIDSVSFGLQVGDTSYGRYPDGGPDWIFYSNTTPNAPNAPNLIPPVPVDSSLVMYPNPLTSGLLHFNQCTTFHLFNSIGDLMMYRENVSEVNIQDLPKGVYIVRTAKGQIARLMKIR